MDQILVYLIALGVGFATTILTAISGRGKTNKGVEELKTVVMANHAEIQSKLKAQDSQIAEVKKELTDNGGGTTKDGVRLIREDVKGLKDGVMELAEINQANSTIQLNKYSEPMFRLNKNGECEFVNEKMVDLVGIPYAKLMVRGFLKAIGRNQAERLEFHEQLVDSTQGDVPFCKDCYITTATGACVPCEIRATAYKRKDRNTILFFLAEVKLI